MEPTVGDAWGNALSDQLAGREVATPELEVEGGDIGPAMHPEWFFRTYDEWDWWERELLDAVARGPVLDLGCGAGRASLWFQERGFDVCAIDNSPGAVEVSRRRGVRDVRLGDVNDPPADKPWGAVLLLCGNLGLGGSWEGNRALLSRLASISAPDAVLIGDSVNYTGEAELGLRIRYGGEVTPWWRQRNVRSDEVDALVEATGWRVDQRFEDGMDHAVLLRQA